jgi:hypothetical protein
MGISKTIIRIRNLYRQNLSVLCGRRMVELRPKNPVISFTFDDFPQSALREGGAILTRHGVRGTYYVSLGLMGRELPAGPGFLIEDLKQALAEGHELGCHTFTHCHAWETDPDTFEQSIIENRRALDSLLPGTIFKTLSYPLACPRPLTKRKAAKYFICCRGGGQAFHFGRNAGNGGRTPAFNVGPSDANSLQTCFLEKYRDNPDILKKLIDDNHRSGGWLIFATHDVCLKPSACGCLLHFFEDMVSYAVASGCRVLPVAKAWESICEAGY